MNFSPVFLVTEFKNVHRASPANEYTGSSEKLDLFKVGMIHGYYAGMGLNLFYTNEAEANRFTKWTIYDPSEIIQIVDDEKFTVQAIKKIGYMGPMNQYTDQRILFDSWKVSFEGDRRHYLDVMDPWEAKAREFKTANAYTMMDVLGVLPAVPRDTRILLEAFAEQRRAEEARAAELAAEAAIVEAASMAAGIAQAGRNLAAALAGTPPVNPPPPPPPPPPPTIEEQKSAAVSEWLVVTDGGVPCWLAAAFLSTGQLTWAQAWPRSLAGQYVLYSGYHQVKASNYSAPSLRFSIRNVVNDLNFEILAFFIRLAPNQT